MIGQGGNGRALLYCKYDLFGNILQASALETGPSGSSYSWAFGTDKISTGSRIVIVATRISDQQDEFGADHT